MGVECDKSSFVKAETLSERFKKQGLYKDARQYADVTTSNEMEIAATRLLHESLKKRMGATAAVKLLEAKRYYSKLLNR